MSSIVAIYVFILKLPFELKGKETILFRLEMAKEIKGWFFGTLFQVKDTKARSCAPVVGLL